ncbi:MAG: metal-dependent hydrolase [Acidimicrobiales bacterium]
MSWAAHQFEIYAVQAHLPKKMRGKVSFFGILLGDFTPDFLSKFWVYGITIGDRHYGATVPQQWHRGWPGMGPTHTLFLGIAIAGLLWLWQRNRALTIGYVFGYAAHALTDVSDSVGTMLLFPFSTLNWTLETWAYAATRQGGKYLDAAAYYSSLGLVMDLFWLGVVLASWRVLTREYWRTEVVPADPHVWSWLGKYLPEPALVALYRATFFYGVCRLVAWSTWAHLLATPVIDGVKRRGFPYDLSWNGPWWLEARSLPHVSPLIVLPVTLTLLGLVYLAVNKLWEPMGRAQRTRS